MGSSTSTPVSPSTTTSGMPPTRDATTGRPASAGLDGHRRDALGVARQHAASRPPPAPRVGSRDRTEQVHPSRGHLPAPARRTRRPSGPAAGDDELGPGQRRHGLDRGHGVLLRAERTRAARAWAGRDRGRAPWPADRVARAARRRSAVGVGANRSAGTPVGDDVDAVAVDAVRGRRSRRRPRARARRPRPPGAGRRRPGPVGPGSIPSTTGRRCCGRRTAPGRPAEPTRWRSPRTATCSSRAPRPRRPTGSGAAAPQAPTGHGGDGRALERRASPAPDPGHSATVSTGQRRRRALVELGGEHLGSPAGRAGDDLQHGCPAHRPGRPRGRRPGQPRSSSSRVEARG